MSGHKEKYIEIMGHELREIIGSPLVLDLLNLYSKLFLNNAQPGYCEKCLRKYYNELKKYGMEKIELQEKIKNRTCIPKWNGLLWIPSVAEHFSSENITDEKATENLIDGHLRESHFEKLPDQWLELNKTNVKKLEVNDNVDSEKKPVKKSVKKIK
jgi:hypothetical protein